jgi:hypothetical protein
MQTACETCRRPRVPGWLWQARTLVSSALAAVDATFVRRYVREEEQLIGRLSSPRPPVGPLHRLEHDLDVNVLSKAHSLDGLLDEDAKLGARVAKLGHFENG